LCTVDRAWLHSDGRRERVREEERRGKRDERRGERAVQGYFIGMDDAAALTSLSQG
jgi:hypothetical protein